MSGLVPSLWGVAAALYAWECLIPVPRDRLALASRFRRFRATAGSALPGTRANGYLFANPLPPFGLTFVLEGEGEGAGHDFRAVRRRLEQVRREVAPLNGLGAVSFAAIFVALPAAEALRALPAVAPWLFGLVLIVHAASLVLRRRALRRLGLRSHGSETLLVAASPLLSLRIGGSLATRAFDGFEPLAVAFVLLPAREFLELARSRSSVETAGGSVRDLLRAAGVEDGELDRHVFIEDRSALSFCPRCRSFFSIADGACPDCGATLERLDESRRTAARRIAERVERRSRELSG